ncbi:MAG: DegT/DnrJ/EryC1/StrS family aminotransferase [Lentisphaerae bacterium]|nr:DegT/DnrJ/EryC1/StrS family aminotransferase [Lentisphaerota bacterium]
MSKATNITAGYDFGDGVPIKVRYIFRGTPYGREELAAVKEAFRGGTLTMGPQVEAFEKEFARYVGCKRAFAVSNCTTAMHVVTQMLDIGPGDEVIVTPNTFIATSLVIVKEGATPVYADIDPRTFNILPAAIEKKITRRTKAIYVVHYGGQSCDMDAIMRLARKHKLPVMEDCAHAHGTRFQGKHAGTFGVAGCFSFHSLKNITTCGEGGMITINDERWADAIQRLRCMNVGPWRPAEAARVMKAYGLRKRKNEYWLPSHFDVEDVNGHWGINYRMNEVQAAVGRAQLRKLDAFIAKRRAAAHYLTERLQGIPGITPVYEDPRGFHAYHLYTLCVEEDALGASRDAFLRELYYREGIQGIQHYQPTYDFTGFRKLGQKARQCPEAERFFYHRETNLPMHPMLTQRELRDTVRGVRRAAAAVRGKGL